MKVLFLPREFSEVLHMRSRPSFEPYAKTVREGDNIEIRIGLEDFTEDDIIVAVAEELLAVLGTRPPASFCIQLFIPSNAVLKDIEAKVEERVLVVRIPLRPADQS